MLKFFSTGHLSRYIIISFLVIFFWIPAFLNPVSYHSVAEPLFLFISTILNINPYLSIISTLIISIFSALLINQLASDYEFSGRFSSLGMFFFVILSASLPAFFSFNPIILSNVFILFLLKNVFRLPTTAAAIPLVFNSGFLIGAASLLFPPLLILIFFLWGAIIIHRMTEWRNFVASLIGIVLPYLFLFTWYFWIDSVYEIAIILFEDFFIQRFSLPDFSLNFIIIIYLLIIIISTTLITLGHLREKNINLRRNLMIIVLYLVFTLALASYYYNTMETLLLVAIPAALLLSNHTFQSKKLKLLNISIYLLIGLILLNLYWDLGKYLLNNLLF